ncbi:hypothetical protein AB0L63_19350 [Nocardia sp. NPDC051990]|uniref:hypothetical protein n=1 Tax=Nocardia sp. NPDC051990 TaxID=3155285 RepID=UPI003414E1A7
MDAALERLVTVVVDAIPPRSDMTAADVYRAVCDEVTRPPSREQVEQVLEVLQTPGLRYAPGDVGWAVVLRLRDLEYLADPARANDPPPPDYNGPR